jgi:thiol-disulfide isomerase/thioredoxin
MRLTPLLLLAACVPRAVLTHIDTLETQIAELQGELRAHEAYEAGRSEQIAAEVLAQVELKLPAAADKALRTSVRDAVLAELFPKDGPPVVPLQGANPDEEEAMDLYKAAAELAADAHPQEAIARLDDLLARYPNTRAASAARRLLAELNVVGTHPQPLTDVQWFQGKASWDSARVTIAVFWEVWCPHCKREVPKLQETYAKWAKRGLQVIGLTKLTRGKTRQEVMDFVAENHIQYPIGWEGAEPAHSEEFGVAGVPAVGVVKDGTVIWRGHPAQITDEMIEGWLAK